MKKSLLCSLILFIYSGLWGGMPAAHASHILGGDLTYTSLGGSQYRVKLRVYNDCSGAPATAFTLECRNGVGCSAPLTLAVPLVLQGAPVPAQPLCPGTPGSCASPSSVYPLFSFSTYEATVALPPGQWTLGTSQSARALMRNVVGNDFYTEAFLDNRGANVVNNSPQFDADDTPVQYVNWQQLSTVGFSAIEPDGDSVAYALAAPMQACGTAIPYNPVPYAYPVGCILLSNPLCIMQVPVTSGYFSPTYPLMVAFDTVGTCPIKTGVPVFQFNQEARTITFKPGAFSANQGPASGDNKYIVAVVANEFRRINGVRRLVGSIRHEVVLLVTDASNKVPNLPVVSSQTAGSGARVTNTRDTTAISVYACSYSRIQVNFTDPDNLRTPSAHQPLTVTIPADVNTNPQLLDSGEVGTFSLAGNGTDNPVGTFFLQPSAAAAGRTIRVNVRIDDNGCPVKGRQNRVIVIRVLRGNFATITAPSLPGASVPAINIGSALALVGRVQRPDSVRRFATGTTAAQGYSYQWTVQGNGLDPNQATGATIMATPTVTSRYFLRVQPLGGFGMGCADTTSMLVQVIPTVARPVITQTGTTLSSSAPTGNQWYLDGVLIAGATGQRITATSTGTYTVVVTLVVGTTVYTSAASAPLAVLGARRALPGTSLSVAPNPTPDGHLAVVLAGYSRPVALTVLDALGRRVATAAIAAPNPQGTTQSLDLSGLPTGVYVLQVRTDQSLETRRIVRE